MKRAKVAIAVVATLAMACNRDLSSYPPYRDVVGKTVPLKEAIGLWQPRQVTFLAPFYLGVDDQYGGALEVARLPVGTPVSIDKVIFYEGIDAQYIFAVGRVRTPQLGEVVFEYGWDYYGLDGRPWHEDSICRAPWEERLTPLARYVGPYGRSYGEPEPPSALGDLMNGSNKSR